MRSTEAPERRIEDGGPAFPFMVIDRGEDCGMPHNGMTLRDWFAGMALTGLLANHAQAIADLRQDAEIAYSLADAMLRRRREGQVQ